MAKQWTQILPCVKDVEAAKNFAQWLIALTCIALTAKPPKLTSSVGVAAATKCIVEIIWSASSNAVIARRQFVMRHHLVVYVVSICVRAVINQVIMRGGA